MLKEGHFLVENHIIKPIYMNKSLLARYIVMGFIVGTALYAIVAPNTTHADLNNVSNEVKATLVHNGHLTICKLDKDHVEVVRTIKKVEITFYTSTKDQTDDTPNIMASGNQVYDGAIATNMFPFGTKVRIPRLFGDKVFTVEDRMHERFSKRVDVWLPGGESGKKEAFRLGKQRLDIEIVES